MTRKVLLSQALIRQLRVGDDYQVDLPNLANSLLQDVEFKDTLPSKKRLIDSSIAPGTTVVIQKGSLVWVGRDSVQNQTGVHSLKSTFMKGHRYFPVFLQTDILSTNTLVDVGKHVNILRSKAQLEKILGRPLQKNELEFVKLDNIQVKTFDGIIIENISRIYGYVHKLFLRTKILLSPLHGDEDTGTDAQTDKKEQMSAPSGESVFSESAIVDIMKTIGRKIR